MHGFYGTFMHTLDPKNRVFVPAKLRNDLGESFYITRKLTKKALAVYPAAEWEKLEAKLNALPDSDVGDIKLFLFSHSITAVPSLSLRKSCSLPLYNLLMGHAYKSHFSPFM